MANTFFTQKRTVVLVVLVVFISMGVCVANMMNTPNVGTLVESDGTRMVSSGAIRNVGFTDEQLFQDEVTTSCFSFTLRHQYSPKIEEESGKCVVRSGLFDPKGQLTVSWQILRPDEQFSENTGIQLREKNPTVYTPVNIGAGQFTQVVVYDGEQETTMFVETGGGILVISLHDFLGEDSERHTLIQQVADSIDLL